MTAPHALTVPASPSVTAPARPAWTQRLRSALSNAAVRASGLSIFDQAVVSATNFATSVLIGRSCGKTGLGTYYAALSVVLFVRTIQEQLVSSPYMVYAHRREGTDLARYGGSLFVHHFAITGLALLGLFGLSAGLDFGYRPTELSDVLFVLLAAIPFLLLREHVRQFLFAHLEVPRAVAVDAGVAALQLASLGLLAWHGSLTVGRAYLVMAGACGVACLAWWCVRRPPLRLESSRILTDWRTNWRFGRWAVASQLIGSAALYLMPWIVVAVHGRAETGTLAACTTLVGLANMFVVGLSNYLSPKAARAFAEGGRPALVRVLRLTATTFVVALGAFCAAIFATGDLFAVLVYGPDYAGTGPVVAALAVNMLAGSLAITAGNGLWALDRPEANFRADLCALAATSLATVILIGPLGVLGAALATLAGSVTSAVVRGLTLRKLFREFDSHAALRSAEPARRG